MGVYVCQNIPNYENGFILLFVYYTTELTLNKAWYSPPSVFDRN